MNPQANYVQAALQMQRWRDFGSQVFAYVIGSIVFIVIWAAQGRGFFGPSTHCWCGVSVYLCSISLW